MTFVPLFAAHTTYFFAKLASDYSDMSPAMSTLSQYSMSFVRFVVFLLQDARPIQLITIISAIVLLVRELEPISDGTNTTDMPTRVVYKGAKEQAETVSP